MRGGVSVDRQTAWRLIKRSLGCVVIRLPPIPSIGWSSGKKNPVKPMPVVAGNGPHVGPQLFNRH